MVASSTTTNKLEREDHKRDADFNKALHGKSAQTRGGISAMLSKNKDAKKAAVDEYFKHFDNQSAKDETPEQRAVSQRSNHPAPNTPTFLMKHGLRWRKQAIKGPV